MGFQSEEATLKVTMGWLEERHLRNTFGAAYEEHCKAVPRWVPRWKRAEG